MLVADRVGAACTEIVVLAVDVHPDPVVTVTEALTVPAPFGVKVAGFAVLELRLPDVTTQLALLTLLPPGTVAVSNRFLLGILQIVDCDAVIERGLTNTTVAEVITLLLHTPEVMVAVTLKVPELSEVAVFNIGFWTVEEKLGPLHE